MDTPILGIKVSSKLLFILEEKEINVYITESLIKIQTIATYKNPRSIFAYAYTFQSIICIYPAKKSGHLGVMKFSRGKREGEEKIHWVHSSTIGCVCLNEDGTLAVTASEKGTLVRVYKVDTGEVGFEFRRGKDKAEIYSLNFNDDNTFISCTTSKNTIHIFSLLVEETNEEGKKSLNEKKKREMMFKKAENHEGILGKLGKYIFMPTDYLKAERSFAQFRVPDCKSIATFAKNSAGNMLVITENGKYYEVFFDQESGGDCIDNYKMYDIEEA